MAMFGKTKSLKQKNLVIIHLESLSKIYFELHRHLFPNLNKIISKSLYLNKNFTASTNTVISLVSALYGNSYELDSTINFFSPKFHGHKNIFSILENHGYKSAFF